MNKDACFELGYIEKAHGVEGAVQIFLDVDDPSEYKELESVFVEINNKLVPFFVTSLKLQQKSKAYLVFEDIDSRPQAEELKGKKLYLPLTELPELRADKFYYHEITGFTVFDENSGELGKVEGVYEGVQDDLVAVIYRNKEILIPINDRIIRGVDRKKQSLNVCLPDGLIDVYLNE